MVRKGVLLCIFAEIRVTTYAFLHRSVSVLGIHVCFGMYIGCKRGTKKALPCVYTYIRNGIPPGGPRPTPVFPFCSAVFDVLSCFAYALGF